MPDFYQSKRITLRRLPSPQELETFLAIEETRNMTTAADRMNVSQPALSQMLKKIEDSLETILFDRSTRLVALSPAGQQLLPIAKRILQEYRRSFDAFEGFVAGERGKVVVAGLPSISAALLPQAILRMAGTADGIEVQIRAGDELQVLHDVKAGIAEFGLATQAATQDGFSFTPLMSDELVLLCEKDDVIAKRENVRWKELNGRWLLALSSGSSVRGLIDRTLADVGSAVDMRYEAGNIALVGPLIAAGLGVSVVPRLAVSLTDCRDVVVRDLVEPRLHRTVGIVRLKSNMLSPAAMRLATALEAGAATASHPLAPAAMRSPTPVPSPTESAKQPAMARTTVDVRPAGSSGGPSASRKSVVAKSSARSAKIKRDRAGGDAA